MSVIREPQTLEEWKVAYFAAIAEIRRVLRCDLEKTGDDWERDLAAHQAVIREVAEALAPVIATMLFLDDCDYWYANHAGIDVAGEADRARKALADPLVVAARRGASE